MKKINLHGMKITGLRKASGSTGGWNPRSGGYEEIFYDRSTGEVWTISHANLGHNSWTEYHDPNIIRVATTDEHMTMQQIADAIREAVNA